MGFSRLPAKVNARGIEIDRAAPFALHAEANLRVPAGPYRLILRAKGAARLLIDGRLVAETDPIQPNASGHEAVPEVPAPEDPRWREIAAGDQERVVAWTSDGEPHTVELWAVLGARKLRPEPGEMSVSIVAPGGVPVLVGGAPDHTSDPRRLGRLRRRRAGPDRRPRRRRDGGRPPAARTPSGRPATSWPAARRSPSSRPTLPADVFRPDALDPIDRLIGDGLAKAGRATEPAGRRRGLPAPAEPRHDRRAADGRGGRGVPGRHAPGQAGPGHRRPPGRPALGRRLDGLLAGRAGREPRHPQADAEQHRAVPLVAARGVPRQHAVRPVRHRAGADGRQQALRRPGRLRHGHAERRADGRQGPRPGQGVPRRRHEVRPLPRRPGPPLRPGAPLRPGRPARRQAAGDPRRPAPCKSQEGGRKPAVVGHAASRRQGRAALGPRRHRPGRPARRRCCPKGPRPASGWPR